MRIWSAAPVLPYEGIPYAGARYYFRHLNALAKYNDVTVVCPNSRENRDALDRCGDKFSVELVEAHTPPFPTLINRIAEVAFNAAKILTPGPYIEGALSSAFSDQGHDIDIVELHWSEYAGLVPRLKESLRCPIVVFDHDVYSQKIDRLSQRSNEFLPRVRAKALRRHARRREQKLLGMADAVAVFSLKDKDILRRIGVTVPISVIYPPLDEPGMPDKSISTNYNKEPTVLFEGALDRQPNHDAASWFCTDIWPIVRRTIPTAKLLIAGNGARPALIQATAGDSSIELTGYVESWRAVYESSDIAIVPLRMGAGLKFKVATAMLWGKPVISTRVGAEGYPLDQGIFFAVEDDAVSLADAVTSALRDPASCRGVAERSQRWASERFSSSAFERRIGQLYSEIVANYKPVVEGA